MQDVPSFSVIIPTYNRPQALVHCLESFLKLDYPAGQWDLIVVNDGGTDSFTAVSDELKEALPVRLITKAHGGPAAARNAGAKMATGDFLAFTDDDCQVTQEWLTVFADGFADGRCQALGGHSLTPFTQNPAERAWQHLTDFLNLYMQDESGNALLLISNNVAYQREIFNELGGFNETFPLAAAEDMELSCRLLANGYQQRILAEARVWHYHHLTAVGHLKQQFRYGRGGYYFNQILQAIPSKKLRKLYMQESFYPSLWQSFRRVNLPLLAACLVVGGQYSYKLGLRYQTLRARFES